MSITSHAHLTDAPKTKEGQSQGFSKGTCWEAKSLSKPSHASPLHWKLRQGEGQYSEWNQRQAIVKHLQANSLKRWNEGDVKVCNSVGNPPIPSTNERRPTCQIPGHPRQELHRPRGNLHQSRTQSHAHQILRGQLASAPNTPTFLLGSALHPGPLLNLWTSVDKASI